MGKTFNLIKSYNIYKDDCIFVVINLREIRGNEKQLRYES